MKFGFHTISLLLHDEASAARELTKIGFQCVAVRPRMSGLDPSHARFVEQVMRFSAAVARLKLEVVYDIDAQYLHDPRQEHGPMLAADDAGEADEAEAWIAKWIDIVAEHQTNPELDQTDHQLGSLITFASGRPSRIAADTEFFVPSAADEAHLERLAARLDKLVERAKAANVRLAIRPVSQHTVATVAQFERLRQWLGDRDSLFLAADVGEMLLGGEFPVGDRLARNTESLACVYLCEPDTGRVRDRRVGTGDVDLSRVVDSLKRMGFRGPAIFRVQGHSEIGLQIAQEAWEFLA